MVGAIYSYNKWEVVVLEEGKDSIVRCGECVGCTRMYKLVEWV